MAKISVVIPVYKVEPSLRQCLDSVVNQTFRDLEIIAVDDGSPDHCGAICDEYAARDSRVRVIHKPNGGLVSAWKAGVAVSTAPYIGFVDGDDWVEPGFFHDLYAAITASGADVVVGERSEDREGFPSVVSRRKGTVTYEGPEGIRQVLALFFTSFLHTDRATLPMTYSRCDKLYRRELVLNNWKYYNEDIALDEDRVANSAILADCRKVLVLSGVAKYHYRIDGSSMSHVYDEAQVNTLATLYDALAAVAVDKGTDMDLVLTYIGGAAYRRIYTTARQRGVSLALRRQRVQHILSLTPSEALARYAAARGGLAVRLFCTMLTHGMAAPCVLLVAAHSLTQRDTL